LDILTKSFLSTMVIAGAERTSQLSAHWLRRLNGDVTGEDIFVGAVVFIHEDVAMLAICLQGIGKGAAAGDR
jgi:hypothetical protein